MISLIVPPLNLQFSRIFFKFEGEFSNQENMQQFCHTVVKLNVPFEYVFQT